MRVNFPLPLYFLSTSLTLLTFAYFYTENIVYSPEITFHTCKLPGSKVMRPSFNTDNIQELKILWVLFIIVSNHLVIKSEIKEVSKHLGPK